MHYPADMTAEDIMEFEYEYNRYLDRQDPNSLIAVNEELQLIANEERDMSMRDLMIDLQDEIRLGVLSFAEIAQKYEVPTSWVQEAWDELCEQEAEAEHNDNWYDEQYELEADYY